MEHELSAARAHTTLASAQVGATRTLALLEAADLALGLRKLWKIGSSTKYSTARGQPLVSVRARAPPRGKATRALLGLSDALFAPRAEKRLRNGSAAMCQQRKMRQPGETAAEWCAAPACGLLCAVHFVIATPTTDYMDGGRDARTGSTHARVARAGRVARLFDLVMMNDHITAAGFIN